MCAKFEIIFLFVNTLKVVNKKKFFPAFLFTRCMYIHA
jgi:hypothetical protein